MTHNLKALIDILNEELANIDCSESIRALRDAAREIIELLGGEYIGSGCYATAYRFESFCIKVTDDDLNSIAIWNPFVQAWTPKIIWVHTSGHVFVSRYVEIKQDTNRDLWRDMVRDVIDYFRNEAGLELWDMHGGNFIMDTKGNWWIVDIGCFRQFR